METPTKTPTERSNVTVEKFMARTPLCVDIGLSLADAQDRMFANNVRHLIVTQREKVVGVLSTRDAVLVASFSNSTDATLADAMAKEPFTCSAQTRLLEVVETMEANRYGTAVITHDDRPVGIFTTTDALRALREHIGGERVEPLVHPTHVTEVEERKRVDHSVRMSDRLGRAAPSPGTGRIGRF
ncbi:MAG: CBS domain-containing protein [Nannocystaceae bacterium]